MPTAIATEPPLTGVDTTRLAVWWRRLHVAAAVAVLLLSAYAAREAGRLRPSDGAVWTLGRPEVVVRDVPPRPPGVPPSPLRRGDVILGIANRLVHSPQDAARILNRQRVGSTVTYLVRRDGRLLRLPVPLTGFRTGDRYYIYYTILALAYWLIGLLVYLRGGGQPGVELFFWMCLAFTVFFLTNLSGASYFWSDLLLQNAGALARFLLPALFLHFFLVFPERKIALTRRPWLEPLLYAVPMVFYFQFTVDQFFGQHAPRIYNTRWLVLGIYFTAGVVALLHSYLHIPDPLQRRRLRILTAGTVAGVLPFLAFTVLPAGRVTADIAFLGIAPMMAVPLAFGYSIARYRVLQIEWLLRRGLAYQLLSGILLAAYLALVVLVGTFAVRRLGTVSQPLTILLAVGAAALLWPVRRALQDRLDRHFFRSRGHLAAALQEIGQLIPRLLHPEELVAEVGSRLCRLLDVPRLGLYLPAGDGDWRLAGSAGPGGRPAPPGGAACPPRLELAATARRLAASEEPYWLEGGPGRLELAAVTTRAQADLAQRLAERDRLRAAGFALLVPLVVRERLAGVLALPRKRTGEAYQLQDLELLSAVASQAALQLENTRLYREALERQRLAEQLRLARSIQSRLLPGEVPRLPQTDLAACNISSAEVSGDYYDLFLRPDGRLVLAICDVSGKGMPASLLASNLQATLRAHCELLDSPAAVLARVNRQLHAATDPEHFATLFLAYYDPADRSLRYCNGGHNPPLLARRDGRLETLEAGGLPVGAFPEAGYEEATVRLAPGDSLLLYTDGLTESGRGDGEMFGEERAREIFRRCCDRPAADIVAELRAALERYCGRGPLDDDVTLVVLKVPSGQPAASSGDPAADHPSDRSVS